MQINFLISPSSFWTYLINMFLQILCFNSSCTVWVQAELARNAELNLVVFVLSLMIEFNLQIWHYKNLQLIINFLM